MKKIIFAVVLGVLTGAAHAGSFYDNTTSTDHSSLRTGYAGTTPSNAVLTSSGTAVIQSTSTTSGHKTFVVKNQSGTEVLSTTQGGTTAGTFSGPLTGNAATATALAADGSNCSAGQYPLGVDASGAVQGCTAAGVGDATQAGSNTWAGSNSWSAATLTGGGLLRQSVSSTTVDAFVAAGSSMTMSDIKPQQGEGQLILSATISPVNSTSNIWVYGVMQVTEVNNNCGSGVIALFKDATLAAIASFGFNTQNILPDVPQAVAFKYKEAAASTSSRTYKVRVGCENATTIGVNVNRSNVRVLGGTLVSSLYVDEIAP